MVLRLRQFRENDLVELDHWCKNIHSKRFMSRTTPRFFSAQQSVRNDLWEWYVIELENRSVGTVWLEKENADSEWAVLGIVIGFEDFLGKGIGAYAISEAIAKARKNLRFSKVKLNVRKTNSRAISCYRKCGFSVIREDIKTNDAQEQILFYEMILEKLHPPLE